MGTGGADVANAILKLPHPYERPYIFQLGNHSPRREPIRCSFFPCTLHPFSHFYRPNFFPFRMNDLNKDGTDGDEKLPAQSYFPIVSVQHMFEFNNITIVNACLVKLTNSKHRNVSGPIYHNDICIPCQVLLIYCDICNISTVI